MTKTDISRRVGAHIRALRDAAQLTQPQLAERVGKRGIETESISRYERGTRLPSLPALAEVASALGTDLDTFLAGMVNVEPVDRTELKKIVALLEPLSDVHLRAVRAMIAAHLEGVAAAAHVASPRETRGG